MASRCVKREQGLTLIELMIGLSLGCVVLLCVFHLLMMGLSSAKKIDYITQVDRKLNEVHQLIYHELRRAGHQINQASVSQFSDSDHVVYVNSNGDRIGVVYQVKTSGDEAFRHVMFLFDESNNNIKVCDKYASSPLTLEQASQSTRSAPCFTLFDRMSFKVDRFHGQFFTLNSDDAQSGVIAVEIMLSSVIDPSVAQQVSFRVTQRSWI
jgi:prepilin-type N-terminal cleavage/methylation domain-containing protein